MLRVFKNSRQSKVFDCLVVADDSDKKGKISISESFQRYIEEILPRYETQIETTILRNLYHSLENPLLKKHLINVYKRRQLHLIYKAFKPDMSALPIRPADPPPPPKLDYLGTNIAKVRHSDIGKMYEYPMDEFMRYFPKVNYGHLHWVDQVMRYTMSFAFHMSPEAFTIIENMRIMEHLREVPFESFRMAHLFRNASSKQDLEILLTDHEIFLKLLSVIGGEFRTILFALRFHPKFKQLFSNSFLTDYIAMILVWSLDRFEVRNLILNSDLRPGVLKRIIDEIMDHPNSKYFLPYSIDSWLENQKIMTLSSDVTIDLVSMRGYHKKIPEALKHYAFPNFIGLNSNILVWGVGGAGKSGLLHAVTMYGVKSNWLVIKMASAKAITHSWIENLVRHERSRLWMAPVMAKAVLEDIYNTNREILAQIQVNMDLYGKYDIVGVHKDEEPPVPNFYIEDRQTYFYEADKFRTEEDIHSQLRDQEPLEVTLGQKLPNPKNLLEVAEYALKNEVYCTNAIAEILEQAYSLDSHSVLITIDDYNWLYRPTNNPAFYYQNIKTLEGFVPPYHVALCRLFMKFDGHMIKNGFKVAGTSNFSITRHYFEPKKIHFPDEFCQELAPMRVKDMEYFLAHFYESKFDTQQSRDWHYYKTLWMETQGNYGRIVRLLRYPEFRGLDG